MLDRSLRLANSSIRNFQQGKAKYIADVVEHALLLPDDTADLRTMRKHKVFLSLKRDLAMVSLKRDLAMVSLKRDLVVPRRLQEWLESQHMCFHS